MSAIATKLIPLQKLPMKTRPDGAGGADVGVLSCRNLGLVRSVLVVIGRLLLLTAKDKSREGVKKPPTMLHNTSQATGLLLLHNARYIVKYLHNQTMHSRSAARFNRLHQTATSKHPLLAQEPVLVCF
jgi:hypothetical protein